MLAIELISFEQLSTQSIRAEVGSISKIYFMLSTISSETILIIKFGNVLIEYTYLNMVDSEGMKQGIDTGWGISSDR